MGAIKRFFVGVVMKKVVLSASKLIVSFAVAHGIKLIAGYDGLTINIQDEAGMVVLFNTGLKAFEHYLSHKFPSLAWLDTSTVDNMPTEVKEAFDKTLCNVELPDARCPAVPPKPVVP